VDDERVWTAIDTQRERVADLLGGLSDDQWGQPSLCRDWTVRHVAAHLTRQPVTLGDALRVAVRHPGLLLDVNRMIHRTAVMQATALSTDEIVAAIRATVGERRHNVGVTHRETLVDIVVHGLDIAVPLHLDLDVAPDVAAEAAARVRSYDGRGKARVFRSVPLADYRLVATDVPWTAGEGPEVRGPVLALLLLLTGRPARLGELTGTGAEALRHQVVTA
jgi:uncharacterized protein (TIGR03083 family)